MMLRNKFQSTPVDVADDIQVTLSPAPELPISVATLAGELGIAVDRLADQLGDDVFVDEATGLRCITVGTCRRTIDARHDAQAAAVADAVDRLAAATERRRVARAARDAEMAARHALAASGDDVLSGIADRGFGGAA